LACERAFVNEELIRRSCPGAICIRAAFENKYGFGMPVSAEPMAAKSPAIRFAPPPEAASFGKADALIDGG
jgi:hypothetical protein